MTEFPDIIKAGIVKTNLDVYWDSPAEIAQLSETPVLVLSSVFAAGSSEETQLQKILGACTLTAEQYNLIQLEADKKIAWHQLSDKLKPKVVLLFGILPEQLGISAMFRLFAPNNFGDSVWIQGMSIPELEKQPEAKKQLWLNGLKPVFVDKTIGNF